MTGALHRKFLIEELRREGYSLKRKTKRAEIYKRSNPISYVHVPKRKMLARETVDSIRRQIGQGLTRH